MTMHHRAARDVLAVGLFMVVGSTTMACSSGGGSQSGSGGSGGRGASATGGSTTGGSGGRGGSTGSGGAGGGAFTMVGVCGQRGRATANATAYDGYEELFMIGDSGLGVDVCVVRFDVKRVGAAPDGCTDCMWTHLVEYSNPSVMTDTNGACANSDLALNATAIAAIVGSRVGLGFAPMFQGAHGSARMKYFDAMMTWDVSGNATWDPTMNDLFRYDNRDGLCNY
jgi:hypothetical protein